MGKSNPVFKNMNKQNKGGTHESRKQRESVRRKDLRKEIERERKAAFRDCSDLCLPDGDHTP